MVFKCCKNIQHVDTENIQYCKNIFIAETLSQLRVRPSFTPEFMAKSPKLFPELQRQTEGGRGHIDSNTFRGHIDSNTFRGRPGPPTPTPRLLPAPASTASPAQFETENVIRATSKPITNPLLQELFNKNSILFREASDSVHQPPTNLRPLHVKRPALTFAKEEPRSFSEPRIRSSLSTQAPGFVPGNKERIAPVPVRSLPVRPPNSVMSPLRPPVPENSPTPLPPQASADSKKQKLFQSLLNQKKEKEKFLQEILNKQEMKEISPSPLPRPGPPQFEVSEAVASPGRNKILSEAEAAVARRESRGESKSSPEVWAAVKILSQFLERERGGRQDIPDSVVMAIIQLTEFLQSDTQQPHRFPPSAGPSEAQIRLRQQLKAQAENKKARISEILNARSSVEQFMDMERVEEVARLPNTDSFIFSTLPVQ